MSRGDTFVVRLATAEDLSVLATIEQLVWGELKTEILNIEHFRSWFEVFPAGFWVAEVQNNVVGYLAYQKVKFDLDRLLRLNFNQATDHGFIRETHSEHGNCFYGISSCSIHAGAGGALAKSGEQMTINHGMDCAVAFCRMPGFAEYLEYVCRLNGQIKLSSDQEKSLALNYCRETAALVGGKTRKFDDAACDLVLPKLVKRDPVIGRFLKYTEFYLSGVVANYMPDPLSRNFASVLIFDNPSKNNDN